MTQQPPSGSFFDQLALGFRHNIDLSNVEDQNRVGEFEPPVSKALFKFSLGTWRVSQSDGLTRTRSLEKLSDAEGVDTTPLTSPQTTPQKNQNTLNFFGGVLTLHGPTVAHAEERPREEPPQPAPVGPRRRVTVHGPPPVIGDDGLVKEAPVAPPALVQAIQPSRRRVTVCGPAPMVYADGTVGPGERSSSDTQLAGDAPRQPSAFSSHSIPEEDGAASTAVVAKQEPSRRVTVSGTAPQLTPSGEVALPPEKSVQRKSSWSGLGGFLQRHYGGEQENGVPEVRNVSNAATDEPGSLANKLTSQLKTMNEPFKDHRKRAPVRKAGACRVRRSDLNVWAPTSM